MPRKDSHHHYRASWSKVPSQEFFYQQQDLFTPNNYITKLKLSVLVEKDGIKKETYKLITLTHNKAISGEYIEEYLKKYVKKRIRKSTYATSEKWLKILNWIRLSGKQRNIDQPKFKPTKEEYHIRRRVNKRINKRRSRANEKRLIKAEPRRTRK